VTKSIPWWTPQIGAAELPLVREVLESNYINEGDVTAAFEAQIASLVGAPYAVAVTSGTTAITLALMGLGVGQGDEVIVPDITFIATANAVVLAGAKPVLVDIDPRTLNIDPEAAAKAITPRTKAIVPVHVSGRAADMQAICELASRHGLVVVEDAAEALRSKHQGRYLGTHGDAGCFSFSPNKTITTGQGGMIVTANEQLHRRLRELKDQGRPVRGTGGDDIHASLGFNFKLTNLQAAVGMAQLTYLEGRLARQRQMYSEYVAGLKGTPGITLPGFSTEQGETPQWTDALCDRRDDLDQHLRASNIHTRRFWFPLHTQAPYRASDDAFPSSTRVCKRALWLPSAFILTSDDVSTVCTRIREFYGA
jgi:perosamine synthetase